MRALVTGGGGFCGKHLVRYLAQQGVEVHTIGTTPASSHHYALTDPSDLAMLTAAITAAQPDCVLHLAGVSSSPLPSQFYLVNTVYGATLLHALEVAGYGDRPVLLVGTAAEYGRITPEQLPIAETCPCNPYNHYGISKLAQTQMGLTLAQQGRPIVIARPANIIGAGMPPNLALASFARQIRAIAQGEQPPVIDVGNLSSIRDFVDVADVVQIYWQLIQHAPAYGQVVNVCSGRGIAMSDLLTRLIVLSGLEIEIRVNAQRYKPVDIPVHYGSTERLQQLVGHVPSLNLDRVLRSLLTLPANG
ncbi:MAG: NAD-dependent epimerase/dehydratase family protein [Cyanobacteria bacterium]|nr:NAD-dependent epimerase/dehydratase family protein [Cyanobacteriota bacterium]MDW8202552.1 NAD-dependent epimerase/dehydratase family protein [Cyanobacteriota bacterium SKYGB_h_bin112]